MEASNINLGFDRLGFFMLLLDSKSSGEFWDRSRRAFRVRSPIRAWRRSGTWRRDMRPLSRTVLKIFHAALAGIGHARPVWAQAPIEPASATIEAKLLDLGIVVTGALFNQLRAETMLAASLR